MQKLGIFVAFGKYSESFEERLCMIKDAGFECISLDFEQEVLKTEGSWESQVELAQKYSMPVKATHLTGSGMTSIWSECDEAEFVTKRLIDELEKMKQVDVKVGVAHITWGYDVPPAPSKSALERFERITEAAEKFGVYLGLENSVFAEHVRFVLDNIKSKHLGFCYDSGHENAFTPNENYLESYGDRLFAMHLHDNCGSFDNHYPPFHSNGTVDWKSKVKLLKKTDLFKDHIMLEIGAQEEDLPTLIKMSYNAAVKLSKM